MQSGIFAWCWFLPSRLLLVWHKHSTAFRARHSAFGWRAIGFSGLCIWISRSGITVELPLFQNLHLVTFRWQCEAALGGITLEEQSRPVWIDIESNSIRLSVRQSQRVIEVALSSVDCG